MMIETEKTKRGYHALWEYGGGCTNTGGATVICDQNGGRKNAIYVRRRGHLSNGNHALVILEVGDYIIQTYHYLRNFWMKIYRVVSFNEKYAITELVYKLSDDVWNESPPEFLEAAVEAAKEKATCYHCGGAHYIR